MSELTDDQKRKIEILQELDFAVCKLQQYFTFNPSSTLAFGERPASPLFDMQLSQMKHYIGREIKILILQFEAENSKVN